MNFNLDSNSINFEKDLFQNLLPSFLKRIKDLKNSKLFKNNISFREFWGLAIITALRKFREPEKDWLFSVDKNISDDGFIGSFLFENKARCRINYYEKIEQVYLPVFYKRNEHESYNDFLFRFLEEKKLNRGEEYLRDTSLIILNDVPSGDPFYWQEFVKSFFPENKLSFLHVYFIGFQEINDKYIKYHILSFTNQKHRQYLNGQFDLYIYLDGDYEFKIMQEINLLNKKP